MSAYSVDAPQPFGVAACDPADATTNLVERSAAGERRCFALVVITAVPQVGQDRIAEQVGDVEAVSGGGCRVVCPAVADRWGAVSGRPRVLARLVGPAPRRTAGCPGRSGEAPGAGVWGTDIIYYGEDLADYISHEFEEGYEYPETWNPRATVAFWQDFVQ
ncbi:hypothetical protein RMN57_01095 [Kitasatospora sp. CM 4170]|uniref:Uncharacterized protein n=1 Tax=Kitasatospora aburaviensis TaxID=67265 RepID=A0ABW1F6R6_9ACTN|nr:hypothetical protein [Kitasatospora sp. CM 4170]WNM43398.1 hypothetical protein RMN57_01095 [Kitasatospora sp. CM 4170]